MHYSLWSMLCLCARKERVELGIHPRLLSQAVYLCAAGKTSQIEQTGHCFMLEANADRVPAVLPATRRAYTNAYIRL